MKAITFWVTGVSVVISVIATAAPSAVQLRQATDGFWRLEVDGAPFVVKGAGAYVMLPELAASGANTVRLWNSLDHDWVNTTGLLNQAHELGLKAVVGLELYRALDRDYADPEFVDGMLAFHREVVRNRREHPALIVWAIGNETEWGMDRELLIPHWQALNKLAEMIKVEDPLHPTMIVLAGDAEWKIEDVAKYCPAVDILGVNLYGNYANLPDKLHRLGWHKPFMITEYGPRGWWEVETTPWKAVLESTGSKKSEAYRELWLSGALDAPTSLGSLAFIWGHKEEATLTYFGTHLPTGEPTPIVDVLQELWSGRISDAPAPRLLKMESKASGGEVAPGSNHEVRLEIISPFPHTITWRLATDRSPGLVAGGVDRKIQVLMEWETAEPFTTFQAPDQPDTYRLYATVRGAHGKVETGSMPFKVTPIAPETPAKPDSIEGKPEIALLGTILLPQTQ